MKKLLQIYENKLITNVTNFSDKYYYFYNHDNQIFGIEKSISKKEYELIKLSYQEKKIYNTNNDIQKIYEFLYDNKEINKKNKVKIIIFENNKDITDTIIDMLEELYKTLIIDYKDLKVGFIFNHFDIDVEEVFQTLSQDAQLDIYVHNGPFLQDIKGNELLTYIEAYRSSRIRQKSNSDITDLLFEVNLKNHLEFIQICSKLIIKPIEEHIDLIKVLFKNDLNVLKTSKELYLNRNSILFKLDMIHQKTGINIQKFKGACAIKILIAFNNYNK